VDGSANPVSKRDGGPDPAFKVVDRRRPPDHDDAAAPAAPAGSAEAVPAAAIEDLKAKAEDAERRLREISAAYVRMEQDRDAFRERLGRDLDRRVDIARAELLRKVVTVLDDLDRALAAARAGAGTDALLQGVLIVRDHLLKTLASEGVEPMETVGRPFDPDFAEAVSTEAVDDPARDNLVLEELERGFRLRDRTLRPARVRVGRGPAGPADPQPGSGI
jgi:molecular chaperone GrpE